MRNRDILSVYSSGLCELVLAALGFAVLLLISLHLVARVTGSHVESQEVLLLSWQTIILMALWPGQRFWTIRRRTKSGFEHSIIGIPTDDDVRVENRRIARRLGNSRRTR